MSWEVEELQKLSVIQPRVVSEALNDLWKTHPNLYKEVVINAYLDEKINLGKAAELLGMDRVELAEEFKTKGIPVRTPSKADIAAEVDAIRSWNE